MVYAAIDDDYKNLISDVKNNTCVSDYSRALKGNVDNLSVSDGLVLLDSRQIVLPLPAIKPILKLTTPCEPFRNDKNHYTCA